MNDLVAVKVVVVHPCDVLDSYPSGILSLVHGFLRAAPSELSVSVIGCTTDQQQRPVGRSIRSFFGRNEVCVLPLIAARPWEASILPLSLCFSVALLRFRNRLGLNGATLIFHRPESALPFLKWPNRKILFVHYTPDGLIHGSSAGRWRRLPKAYDRLERRVYPKMDSIFCLREDSAESWRQKYKSLGDRIQWIASYVDSEIFKVGSVEMRAQLRDHVIARWNLPHNVKIVLWVGRLAPQKNPLLLLEAWHLVVMAKVEAVLVVAGTGPLMDQARAFVSSRGIQSSVRFVGSLTPTEVANLMNAADAFVMTSTHEGMSVALLEALNCGLPAVATVESDPRGLLDRPSCGISVDRSASDIANGIVRLLGQTRDREACAERLQQYRPERVLAPLFDALLDGEAIPVSART